MLTLYDPPCAVSTMLYRVMCYAMTVWPQSGEVVSKGCEFMAFQKNRRDSCSRSMINPFGLSAVRIFIMCCSEFVVLLSC